MYHQVEKNTASCLVFLLYFLNNLHFGVFASHWINLNVWHDEVTVWDQQQQSSINNFTAITNPGGRQDPLSLSGLPGCHELDGLTDGQIKLCLLFSDHMKPIIQGARLGLSECRWQFRHHHWNCSVLPLKLPQNEGPQEESLLSPTTTVPSQSRVLRENNKNGGNPSRRRNARYRESRTLSNLSSGNGIMIGNTTNGGHLRKEFYSPSDTMKPKKKNRKTTPLVFDESTNNNIVMGMTTSVPATDNQRLQTQDQTVLHLHHHDKEEKSNWNSILTRGTKETAFAQAVWSAAVTEAVSRSCREGSISSCGCGKTPRPADLKDEWRWGGCGDNLQYGYKFAQSFVDIREHENTPMDKKSKARSLVNLHNNEAGRRAVLKKTKVACKCHGVSGSCNLVTCWHQIPTFREIGDFLKQQYEKATPVKLNKRGRLQVKKAGIPTPTVVDLVYIESSPNYCVQNETLGIYGTTGRVCNRTTTSANSCRNLCCNRGFTTNVAKSGHRCNCKFIWCCQVVCEECRSVQKYDVCK